jgi:DNA modification methylase/predicted RNA-binding Zn-ribbon protein involved in translation (DUF1610 family)
MTTNNPTQPRLFDDPIETQKPVECLGITFENDEARRAYFTEKLRQKLQEPEFRQIEGFPIGADEDILALSDPPYYTACPNPFLPEIVAEWQEERKRIRAELGLPDDEEYHRDPFAVDVSEGKTDAIYRAHSYHTKVPYKAIVPAILHYTKPGDLILDGFAGSGMTGVAAQMCANPDPKFQPKVEAQWEKDRYGKPTWGARKVILNDLSPAATFIAANYNIPFDVPSFEREAKRILNELEAELGWMYETTHSDGRKGRINYTVWSEVFACPNCGGEIIFFREALDTKTKKTRKNFPCPHCGTHLHKRSLQRLMETFLDPATRQPWQRTRFIPVVINYTVGNEKYERALEQSDYELLERIEELPLPPSVPTNTFPIKKMYHGSRLAPKGFTSVHHLFLPRARQALVQLWEKAINVADTRLRQMLLYFVEQAIWGMSILNRYSPTHYSQTNQQLTGVYYVPSQHAEVSPWYNLSGKLRRLVKAFQQNKNAVDQIAVTTGSASTIGIPAQAIDYIFTDPPFGANIYYADLNYLVESWHRVWTNTRQEAIVDRFKSKYLPEYQKLISDCFEEYFRLLKPARWITVVFHNSSNAVWNAIQEAMLSAGFVVADVRTMDKKQGSYRQITSTAVKQDLIISAYKPDSTLEEQFKLEAGTEEGAWDFVRSHLRQLPVFVTTKNRQVEVIAERMNYLLFDRMVAFHVQRGVSVPLSAAEFYAGLEKRFSKREGMYFLADQMVEYERKRVSVPELLQLELIVTDESSAIRWLRQQLTRKPQLFQELQPQFMKELSAWPKHELALELVDLLAQNFLRYEGRGPIPPQIWSWMRKSSNLRKLMEEQTAEDADASLRDEAKDRWYVPDPNKAQDLEKLRERALLKEFEEYKAHKGKRLRKFRLEAVRAGFKQAWKAREYATIIKIAEKIPEKVLQEDDKLVMWYDQAKTRRGDGF